MIYDRTAPPPTAEGANALASAADLDDRRPATRPPGEAAGSPTLDAAFWRRFRTAAVLLPIGAVALACLFIGLSPWPAEEGVRLLVAGALGALAAAAIARSVLNAVDAAERQWWSSVSTARRQRAQLAALHSAALTMTQDLELNAVLRQVVELAREVLRSRYAALRVLQDEGPGDFLVSGMGADEIARLGPLPQGLGVLGVVAAAGGSIRLDRIQEHPMSVGFPAGHPSMTTFLGTPVRFHDRTFGYIYLTEKVGGRPFSAEDEETLERFAAFAGATIANAHLLAEVRRLGEAEERERIGRDLHDGTLQELYGIALGLQAVVPIEGQAQDERTAALAGAIDDIRKVMANIRRYVFGQEDQTSIAPVPVRDAIEQMARAFGGRTLATALALPDDLSLPGPVARELIHVVREALSNAVRHSEAVVVRLSAAIEAGGLVVRVEDDGVGFDQARVARAGHGVRNMYERAAGMGARLEIDSQPGDGTRLALRLPLDTVASSRGS